MIIMISKKYKNKNELLNILKCIQLISRVNRKLVKQQRQIPPQLSNVTAVKYLIILNYFRNLKYIDVYNNSRQGMTPRYYKQNKVYAENHLSMYPLCNSIWYPGATLTKCKYLYFIRVLLVHMLPAVLLDSLSKLAGVKPRYLPK